MRRRPVNWGKTVYAGSFSLAGRLPGFAPMMPKNKIQPKAPLSSAPPFGKIVVVKPEEKTALIRFLDLADDYLRDGHARERPKEAFEKAPEPEPVKTAQSSGDFSSLPLAYQVPESANDAVPPSGGTINKLPFGKRPEGTYDAVPPPGGTMDKLPHITAAICRCENCGLAATRTHAVPGEGVPNPLVMVIGEGPGADEDAAGRPFVGKAGQLLDRMLASIGLSRDKNCYIANMVKCRPPENRDPGPEEIAACFPYLKQQITLLRPRLILCAGRVAAQNLLQTGSGISALRGKFAEYKTGETIIPVLCTFHPSYILRDESMKRPAWEDLKLAKAFLESALESLNKE